MSAWLARFQRAWYRTLSFDDQSCLALAHKESPGNEGYHGNEHERDYRPTLQSFELVAEPICGAPWQRLPR
jgi:hypothetical protein